MILNNNASSNEFIIAIQKYENFTTWENMLANKRLKTWTVVESANSFLTYADNDGNSLSYLGNRSSDLARSLMPGTFHSFEYSKVTNIGLKEIVGFGLKWPDTSITTNNIHLSMHCLIV